MCSRSYSSNGVNRAMKRQRLFAAEFSSQLMDLVSPLLFCSTVDRDHAHSCADCHRHIAARMARTIRSVTAISIIRPNTDCRNKLSSRWGVFLLRRLSYNAAEAKSDSLSALSISRISKRLPPALICAPRNFSRTRGAKPA